MAIGAALVSLLAERIGRRQVFALTLLRARDGSEGIVRVCGGTHCLAIRRGAWSWCANSWTHHRLPRIVLGRGLDPCRRDRVFWLCRLRPTDGAGPWLSARLRPYTRSSCGCGCRSRFASLNRVAASMRRSRRLGASKSQPESPLHPVIWHCLRRRVQGRPFPQLKHASPRCDRSVCVAEPVRCGWPGSA